MSELIDPLPETPHQIAKLTPRLTKPMGFFLPIQASEPFISISSVSSRPRRNAVGRLLSRVRQRRRRPIAAEMQRPAPPLRGDGGGSASDGGGPRGEVDSFISSVATRVRSSLKRLLGGEVPVVTPAPRHETFDLISPSARAIMNGPLVTRYEADLLKDELEFAIKDAIKSLKPCGKEEPLDNEHKMVFEMMSSCYEDANFALDVAIHYNKISAEDAADLRVLIARLHETTTNQLRSTSIRIISKIWDKVGYCVQTGSLLKRIKNYVDLFRTIKNIIDSLGHGPGLFKHIGREARGIIYNDFMCSNLRVDQQPNIDKSSVAGYGLYHQNKIRSLLLNLKHADTTVALIGNLHSVGPDAIVAPSLLAKVKRDQLFGAQTKGIMYVPIPYRNAKFEFQSLDRFAGVTASVGLHRNPLLSFSCLLGTKGLSVGGMFDLDTESAEWRNCCTGLSARIGCSSFGLTLNNLGGLTAMYHSFTDKDFQFSAMASHCFPTGRAHVVMGGAMQLLDGNVTVKARVSSSGFASVMLKKFFWGSSSFAFTSEIDLCHIQRAPGFGVVFTLGQSS